MTALFRFSSRVLPVLGVLAAFALLPVALHAQTPPKRVAVLEFLGDNASGVSLQERQTLAQLTRSRAFRALPRTGWIVMTRDNMQSLLPPGLDLADCSGDECVITTGRMIQADYLVTGRVTKLGSNLQIVVQLYDVRTGALVETAEPRGPSMDAVIEKLEADVQGMFARVGGASGFGGAFTESREVGASGPGVSFGSAPPRVIEIISVPPGAVVDLGDGSIFCAATPCSKAIPEGEHRFRLRREQYQDTVLRIKVARNGQKETIRLRPNFALLNVESNFSGITVKVGGNEVGKTPLRGLRVQAGPTVVELQHPCFVGVRQSLNLKRGDERTIRETVKQRQAGLSLRAVSAETGNDVVAEVWGDGAKLGETPFQGAVSVCLQTVELRSEEHGMAEVKPALTEGQVFTAVVKLEQGAKGMANIPAGCFMMGSPRGTGHADERPQHRVCVDAFRMDKTEVTQEAYAKATGKWPSHFKNCPTCPVEQVNWAEAQAYCRAQGGRLPTEAEWEYAARAGTTTTYYWGNSMDDRYAWYRGNSGNKTRPVGEKLPNAWGLHDMAGNVWEWTGDWYDANYYGNSPERNPQGPSSGQGRVLRGGSWDVAPEFLRAANRDWLTAGSRFLNLGFRCVVPR